MAIVTYKDRETGEMVSYNKLTPAEDRAALVIAAFLCIGALVAGVAICGFFALRLQWPLTR